MSLIFEGQFIWSLYQQGVRIAWGRTPNAITTAGLNTMLDDEFASGWSVGLIDTTNYSALSAADSMSSHSGWQEFESYDEANRVAWSPASATGGSLINATSMDFTINAAGSLQGLFVTDDNTKGGTSGNLWSTAAFDTSQTVYSGQNFRIFYQLVAREG